MNYPIANTKLLISQHMLATAANKRLDVDYTASLWSLLNQRDLLRNLALVNCWAQHLTNRCKNNTVPNATKMGTVTEQRSRRSQLARCGVQHQTAADEWS